MDTDPGMSAAVEWCKKGAFHFDSLDNLISTMWLIESSRWRRKRTFSVCSLGGKGEIGNCELRCNQTYFNLSILHFSIYKIARVHSERIQVDWIWSNAVDFVHRAAGALIGEYGSLSMTEPLDLIPYASMVEELSLNGGPACPSHHRVHRVHRLDLTTVSIASKSPPHHLYQDFEELPLIC